MKKKTMAGLIAIVAVAAVLISAGAVYKEEKLSGLVFAQGNQDDDYMIWASNTARSETTDLNLWQKAASSLDFDGMELYAEMLYDDADKALVEIDQFSVSSKLQPSKDEFKLAQEDLTLAAYYAEEGAKNVNFDDIETAGRYFESSAYHLRRAKALLPS